jgi:ATP-dependent helicase/DNAse subunit B
MIGLTLHQVLFDFFRLENDKRNTKSMFEILNKRWKKWNIDQQKEKDSYEQCKIILNNLCNTLPLNADIFTLEYNFKVPIDDDILIGKIDRIDRLKDKTYEIIEYKLGDKDIKKDHEIKQDLQWFIYWYAFKKIFHPMRPKKISFIFLDANKIVSFNPTPLEEKNGLINLRQQINLIKKEKSFIKRPGQYCNNCYFLEKECKY